MRGFSRLRSAAVKPIGVLLFRMRQEAILVTLRVTGYWRRYAKSTWTRSQNSNISNTLSSISARVPWKQRALQLSELCQKRFGGETLEEICSEIHQGQIRVFGQVVAMPSGEDWHRDRVFNKVWPPRYFRAYDFYEVRSSAYDIKRVWEPSRLSFLISLAVAALCTHDENKRCEHLELIYAVLQDWIAANPLAYSVNWYPMEASVRLINSCLVFITLTHLPDSDVRSRLSKMLLYMIMTHLEFVARNLEYTDVRGNHYAANIVALALSSSILEAAEPHHMLLKNFAFREIDREILLQFLPDGMNFERSLPYHVFVLELFFVGAVTARCFGRGLSEKSLKRLEAAADFLDAVRRPDGLVPVLGDNDSARVLTLHIEPPRSPDGLLAAVQAFTGQAYSSNLKATLLGALVSQVKHDELGRTKTVRPVRVFPIGGVGVLNARNAHVLVDFGRVGLNGRGGHSHNDLLSFELTLGGRPIVVDRGCPTYTGNLLLRDEYRSTRSHNTVCLNDTEHAKLLGTWAIEDRASAEFVSSDAKAGVHEILLKNRTFLRETAQLSHSRLLRLGSGGEFFQCLDMIKPESCTDCIVRYFHFSPQCRILTEGDDGSSVVSCGDLRIRVIPDLAETHTWVRRDVSCNYDETEEAYALRVVSHPTGPTTLTFTVRLLKSI